MNSKAITAQKQLVLCLRCLKTLFSSRHGQTELLILKREQPTSMTFIYICRKHWPVNSAAMVNGTSGKFRPQDPPSIFDVPQFCLPTTIRVSRPKKKELLTLSYVHKNDKFVSFSQFDPRSKLRKYDNILYNADPDKIVCVLLSEDQTDSQAVITVLNQTTLTFPATFSDFKKVIKVHVPQGILNPNNGICNYSEFMEAVIYVFQWTDQAID